MSNLPSVQNSAFPTVQELSVLKDLGKMLVESGFLPTSIKTPQQAIAIMLKGREVGIGPMESFSKISIIQGKPAMDAELMLSLGFRRVPGLIVNVLKTDNIICTIEAKRPTGKMTTMSFTMEDANRAGLTGKDNWKKYPAAMLRARVIAAIARAVFPDALSGASHTPDELGAVTDEDGNIRDVTPPQDPPPSNQPAPTPKESSQASKPQDPAHGQPDITGLKGAGDFEIKMAKKEWERRTIRDVVNEIGLPAFMNDVNWWATKSGRKGFKEIINLKNYADEFELELRANHADAEMTEQFKANLENDSFESALQKWSAR